MRRVGEGRGEGGGGLKKIRRWLGKGENYDGTLSRD